MALALLLSVQSSIRNGRAVWLSSKCFTYNASMQPFVIALASDSAEDSDAVACVTDQCGTVMHGPIANTPPDVEHLVFGSPIQYSDVQVSISAFFTKKLFLNSSANASKLDVNPHTRKASPCCSKSRLSQNSL